MSVFSAINLADLPAPDVVETLDYESILADLKADLVMRHPDLAEALSLESEPVVKLLEVVAYREIVLRQRVNDAARANMLAFSVGADLENLGALFGVVRGVIQEADPSAIPPMPAIVEDDTRLRTRIQLALEGFSTAGPVGAYIFWGLSASPDVKDVGVTSPAPGQVEITVLSRIGDGAPSGALIATVASALNADDVRPLTDQVFVKAATITAYSVEASLTLYDGPDSALVVAAANAAVATYVETNHRLGRDITVSGLHAALHQSGVQNVALAAPAASLVIAADTAAHCTSITITFGGRDA
ncbi:baseplate assembly protein [Marinosulfonomonas sp. PRT-SC04]|nr:baseplate assembly protein [Marinosulfonomonas sp. PRT-SC04]